MVTTPVWALRRYTVALAMTLLCLGACSSDPGYDGRTSKDWIASLDSQDPHARRIAVEALGKIVRINPKSRQIVNALSLAIRDTSDEVRMAAANALTSEGVDPIGALSGFHAALHDSAHAQTRSSTARMIGNLGPKRGRMLIPALSEGIDDPDADVRTATIESLGMLGPDPGIDLARINQKITDPDPLVRRAAVQTLLKLNADPGLTLSLARAALRDSVSSVRMAAAYSLGTLGASAIPALPELRVALKDANAFVRAGAAFAIGGIGPQARSVIPDLRRLFADPSKEVVSQATAAVASLEGKGSLTRFREPSLREKCASNRHAAGC